jgi:hypothetical protein
MTRTEQMVDRYLQGQTLQEIGDFFNLSRERIRQLLKTQGISRVKGGITVKKVQKAQTAREQKAKKHLAYWGCSREDRLQMEAQLSSEKHYYRGGVRTVFSEQRNNAKHRGIGWTLTYADWMHIWLASGKWAHRGRGHGHYVMSRIGDRGDYSKENVFIQLADINNSQRVGSSNATPMGVTKSYNRYYAHKMLHGQLLYLGSYATQEAAHEAYLATC